MKIFVCVKQVPDTETKIKLNADNSGIDTNGIKWIVNLYDSHAIEEALKIRDANSGSTVTVVGIGPKRINEALITAMAMGADEAISVDAPENIDSLTTARALAKAIGSGDLILTGKLAIDDNGSAVTQQLAEFLGMPHATVVSKLVLNGNKAVVDREVEGGTKEVLELTLPCVIGCNRGLNNPRFASLPGIMKARKKPIKEIALSQLDVNIDQKKNNFTDFQMPPPKPAAKVLQGTPDQQVQELVKLLKEEAKVL
jgi:electron transfer flavoprotein beta subunit